MASWKEFLLKIGIEADEKPLENIEKRLEGIHHALEFLAAAEIVKGLYEVTERFAKFAEELHVASIAAGMTTEEFQKLSLAAGQSAVSQEDMSMSIARLNRQLYEARMGNAQSVSAFQQAGIQPDDLQRIQNGGQAMLMLSDRFHTMTDSVQKSAIATQLMGRGSYQMIGFLSQGSAKIKAIGGEFQALGAILTEHQVEALVSVEHSLQKLFAVAKAFGAMVATYLAPILNSAIEILLKFYQTNRKIIEVNVEAWAKDVAYAFGFVHGILQGLVEQFLHFAASHQLLIRRAIELVGAFMLMSFGIMAIKFAVGGLLSIWNIWSGTLGALPKILGIVRWAFSELLLALSAVTKAEWLFSAAAAVAEAPLWLIGAAIAALVLGVQALWTVLKGGSFKDTWLGELWGMAASGVGKGLNWIMDKAGSLTGGGVPGASAPGMGGAMQAFGNIGQVAQMVTNPNLSVPGVAASQATMGAPGAYEDN